MIQCAVIKVCENMLKTWGEGEPIEIICREKGEAPKATSDDNVSKGGTLVDVFGPSLGIETCDIKRSENICKK